MPLHYRKLVSALFFMVASASTAMGVAFEEWSMWRKQDGSDTKIEVRTRRALDLGDGKWTWSLQIRHGYAKKMRVHWKEGATLREAEDADWRECWDIEKGDVESSSATISNKDRMYVIAKADEVSD